VTSFFGIKVCVYLCLENDKTDLCQFFFQGLGENICLLQPALKSSVRSLQTVFNKNITYFQIFVMIFFSLFTWSKQTWLFWRAGFYPANQGFLKTFLDCSDWLNKSRPSKKPLLFWTCKQAI